MISKGNHHGLILTGKLLSFAQMFGVPWQQFHWDNIIWGWVNVYRHGTSTRTGTWCEQQGTAITMVWTWFDQSYPDF